MSIIVSNLHKIYRNGAKEVRAVDGIGFDIKEGKAVAITGPSGAGKSTLLHIMGGLDNPTRGEILLDGVDIYKLSDKARAKVRNSNIGFVFQFYHLLPEFTALENVMLPALISNQVRTADEPRTTNHEPQKRANELLHSVGLSDRIHHKPSELSGGETQRVAIARALINDPKILLCDEPTGNLDSKASESILELLFNIRSKRAFTLIIVTHDDKISSRAEVKIHIKDGKISI